MSKRVAPYWPGKLASLLGSLDKPSELLDEQTAIAVKPTRKYVGRGALKLESALDYFHIDVQGKTALDIGASTGGFTDCMLQRGAEKVYAVDVGYGQLDWKLRNDPRVIVLEKINARFLTRDQVQELVNICVIDVSFISLTLHPAERGRLAKARWGDSGAYQTAIRAAAVGGRKRRNCARSLLAPEGTRQDRRFCE